MRAIVIGRRRCEGEWPSSADADVEDHTEANGVEACVSDYPADHTSRFTPPDQRKQEIRDATLTNGPPYET